MKKLQNKETGLTYTENGKADGKEVKMGYADLAVSVLNNMPKDGWDKNNMPIAIKLDSILKKKEIIKDVLYVSGLKIDKEVEIEDADFAYLLERAQPENMKWLSRSEDLLGFLQYLDNIK